MEPCDTCTTPATCSHEGCQRANDCPLCIVSGSCQHPDVCRALRRTEVVEPVPECDCGYPYRACTAGVDCRHPERSHGFEMHFDKAEHLPTGAIRSDASGKGRYDLFPPKALRRVAVVYERGAEQKGDNNWMLGVPRSRLLSSALRHVFQAVDGERDEDHLAHAVWNLLAAIHFEEVEGGE